MATSQHDSSSQSHARVSSGGGARKELLLLVACTVAAVVLWADWLGALWLSRWDQRKMDELQQWRWRRLLAQGHLSDASLSVVGLEERPTESDSLFDAHSTDDAKAASLAHRALDTAFFTSLAADTPSDPLWSEAMGECFPRKSWRKWIASRPWPVGWLANSLIPDPSARQIAALIRFVLCHPNGTLIHTFTPADAAASPYPAPTTNPFMAWFCRIASVAAEFVAHQRALSGLVMQELEAEYPHRMGLRTARISVMDAASWWMRVSVHFAIEAGLDAPQILRLRADWIRLSIGGEKYNVATHLTNSSIRELHQYYQQVHAASPDTVTPERSWAAVHGFRCSAFHAEILQRQHAYTDAGARWHNLGSRYLQWESKNIPADGSPKGVAPVLLLTELQTCHCLLREGHPARALYMALVSLNFAHTTTHTHTRTNLLAASLRSLKDVPQPVQISDMLAHVDAYMEKGSILRGSRFDALCAREHAPSPVFEVTTSPVQGAAFSSSPPAAATHAAPELPWHWRQLPSAFSRPVTTHSLLSAAGSGATAALSRPLSDPAHASAAEMLELQTRIVQTYMLMARALHQAGEAERATRALQLARESSSTTWLRPYVRQQD